jgi:hypothetical protein
VWKNLAFTGGPGCGKSRAAAAVGRIYRELGVLAPGHVTEVASVELAGADAEQTRMLVSNAVSRARGGVLTITDADAYIGFRMHDQQVLRFLQDALNVFDDLTVILAGQPDQLRTLLHASPPLASRFPWVISFPQIQLRTADRDLRHSRQRGGLRGNCDSPAQGQHPARQPRTKLR